MSFCRMRVNLEWGLLYLVLTKSTHPVKAYKKTQEIVVSTTDHPRKYHNILSSGSVTDLPCNSAFRLREGYQ